MLSFSDQYALLAICGSLLFGYHLSSLNTSISIWLGYFQVCGTEPGVTLVCKQAKTYESLLTSSVFLTAAVACILSGYLLKKGRRNCLIALNIISVVGSFLSTVSTHIVLFAIARFINGFAVGLAAVVPPTIINEMSPAKTRGSRSVFHQTSIAAGVCIPIFLGLAAQGPEMTSPVDLAYVSSKMFLCRLTQAIPGILSLVCLVVSFLYYKHDTPLSYLICQSNEKAFQTMQCIYTDIDEATKAFDEMRGTLKSEDGQQGSFLNALRALKRWSRVKVLLYGYLLAASQQLGGINVFIGMSTNVFHTAGIEGSGAIYASVAMSVINCLMSLPSVYFIERWGRIPLLFYGFLLQGFALLVFPLMFFLKATQAYSTASVAGVLVYIFAFGATIGPVLWVYIFEMFPNDVKEIGSCSASALNWICGFLVVFISASLNDEESLPYVFLVFAIICLGSAAFVQMCLLETKGMTVSAYQEKDYLETKPLTP